MELKFVNEFIVGKNFLMAIDLDKVIDSYPSSKRHGDYEYYLAVDYGPRNCLNRMMVLDLDLKQGDIDWLKAKMRRFLKDALDAHEFISEIYTLYRDDKSSTRTYLYQLFELNTVINIIPKSLYESPEDILRQVNEDLMKKFAFA